MMQVVSRTHVGLVRENNEDAMLVREPYLFAVADGMGGYAAGEVASRGTLKAFEAATYALRHDDGETNIRQMLMDALNKANSHVYKMAVSNDAYTGMGTTLTALYLPGDGTAYCAHIGDSRLYLYGDGKLQQLTQDHTYVADLALHGKITNEEALIHPDRHMLLKALGVEEQIEPDCFRFALQDGDRLLLCSDGLSDMVRDEEISRLLQIENLEEAADSLINQSLSNGGRDNVTLVLLSLDSLHSTTQKEGLSHGQ